MTAMIPDTPRYPIGTKFKLRVGRSPAREATVVDIWTTTNSTGQVVRVRYVVEYPFCGQTIRNTDIVATTIARSLHQAGDC